MSFFSLSLLNVVSVILVVVVPFAYDYELTLFLTDYILLMDTCIVFTSSGVRLLFTLFHGMGLRI